MATSERVSGSQAANAGQYKIGILRGAKIEVDFDAAERCRNLIDDPRNQLFEVESGGDALCEFLQAHQFRYPERGCFRYRLAGEAGILERVGGHDKILLPVDCNSSIRLQKSGFRFSFCSACQGI